MRGRFKICRDCYMDAQKSGGICPGCKEPYKTDDFDDEPLNTGAKLPPLPAPSGSSKAVMSNNKSIVARTGDFDHSRWLFESKGTYGYGNAFNPNSDDGEGDEDDISIPLNSEKPWKPLTRKVRMKAGIISPYRLLYRKYKSLQKNLNNATYFESNNFLWLLLIYSGY